MHKPNLTAAVAALMIGTAPVAFGQGPAPTRTTLAMNAPGIIQPDQFRASKMIGSRVYDVHNRDIGSVKDVILNRNGRVAAVIVDVGEFLGIGGKNVAVPLSQIKADNNRLTLDVTKEELQRAQSYLLENPDTGAGSTASPPVGGHLGSASGSTVPSRQ